MPTLIDTSNAITVSQWAKRLNCTPAQLLHATEQVGHELGDIREYLAAASLPADPKWIPRQRVVHVYTEDRETCTRAEHSSWDLRKKG